MNRDSQRAKILALLTEARGEWVPLPEILELGVAQYNARIFELRRQNFNIENRIETDSDTGTRQSWFRLVASPVERTGGGWYERAPGKARPSDATPKELSLFDAERVR